MIRHYASRKGKGCQFGYYTKYQSAEVLALNQKTSNKQKNSKGFDHKFFPILFHSHTHTHIFLIETEIFPYSYIHIYHDLPKSPMRT